MKKRHHNTKGYKQIKAGTTAKQVECMAKRLSWLCFGCGRPVSLAEKFFRDETGKVYHLDCWQGEEK